MSDHVRLDKYVTSYGNFGKCDGCERACMATALIARGKRFCESCKNEKYPKKAVEFRDSDATFKCRAESCGAHKLSVFEFLVGSCCDAAIANTATNSHDLEDERELVNKIFKQIKENSYLSWSKHQKAFDELEAAKIELKRARDNFTTATKKVESASTDREHYSKLEDKSKKRLLIITKAAFEIYDEPAEKKAKQDEVNEKHQCRVCLYPYDDEHPEAIIIPCAHKFCFKCISALPEKKCPNCRAEFADNNVFKTN